MIPGASERRVPSAEVDLAVAEAGDADAPTVVLVHGYPDTKEMWAPVATRLAPCFHVVAYDVRGAGRSTPPPGPEGYRLERLAEDLVAVVEACSGGQGVHLVGHDWGSIQGWELATTAAADGRLASFTSISGPCLDHVGHWLRDRLRRPSPAGLAAVAGQAGRSWYVQLLTSPAGPWVWRTLLGRAWPSTLLRAEGVPSDPHYPGPTLEEDGARGVELYRRNIARRLRHPRPDAVARVPVQVVVPERDRYVSPHLTEDLGRWVPHLRRRPVDAGHWMPRTHPDLVTELVTGFIGDLDAGRNF